MLNPLVLPIEPYPRPMCCPFDTLRAPSCHENGSLTLLFMPIARHSKNILASKGRVASITVADEHPAASRARVSLMGNVTVFYDVDDTPDKDIIEACYVQKHPDARHWLPSGNSHAVSPAAYSLFLDAHPWRADQSAVTSCRRTGRGLTPM